MKNKKIGLFLAAAVLALALAGCNGGEAEDSSTLLIVPDEVTVPEISELDRKIAEYENLLAGGMGTPEDHIALADLYEEAGLVKKQRNVLERCYILYHEDAAFNMLQNIAVNAEEESLALKDQADRLRQNISIEEYKAEAVAMVADDAWLQLMMPKLKEGRRNYYIEDPGGTGALYFEVGYNNKKPYTKAWYTENSGKTITLVQEGSSVQILETSIENGDYNGGFSSWLCLAGSGEVYSETGTMKNGVLVGDYTVGFGKLGAQEEGTSLFELFKLKDSIELKKYSGNFGEDGRTTLEQPANNTAAGGAEYVVYAYDESKKDYLFITPDKPEEGEEGEAGGENAPAKEVFGRAFLGLEEYPEYEKYTPVADDGQTGEVTIDFSQVQIRVFDSAVEWFDGTSWHTMGSVEDYIKQDPFAAVQEVNEAPGDETEGEGTENEPEEDGGRFSSIKHGAGANQNTQTGGGKQTANKPNTNKPTTPTTPVTPPPAETPAPPPEESGGGGGGGGGGTPAPEPDPEPTPDPSPGDGDDIEWTDDFL